MDKTAIKNFAVWARKKLIEDIKQKAYELGITEKDIKEPKITSSDIMIIGDKTLTREEIRQRESLVLRIREKGFNEIVEQVAYTWFNRFIALRFMEVNGYLPSGIRVLSSLEPGKKEPDIIREALNIELDLDRELVYKLQDANDTEGLYRYLIVKQCNALNEILPGLFEKIEDYTEILLPSNLLNEGSVIRKLVNDIPEDDFKDQVEIIGWMYQFYTSEKKDEIFKDLKKNIKISKENIPAATQLFTPHWIVRYMVENSMGRLWLEGHPDEELKCRWKYYLEEAEQEPEVQNQLEEIWAKSRNIKPEDIKVLDPAMGSGHILVYAFDVLYDIYKSAGYSERDIPKLILENNLYGLDIDDRAGQLAYFAIMMKARSKSRRIFREKINLNICAIQESNGIPKEAIDYFVNTGETEQEKKILREGIGYLINIFQDAREYGSILRVKPVEFDIIERRLEEIMNEKPNNLFEYQYRNIILEKIPPLVKQARIMSGKYDVVCANPPYMGSKGMNSKLSEFLKKYFPDSKSDLFAVFMQLPYVRENGMIAMINQHSWMFLSSFEKLRENIILNNTVINMLHLGPRAFEEIGGEVVQSTAFILREKYIKNYKSVFIRLTDVKEPQEKEKLMLSAKDKDSKDNSLYFIAESDCFKAIPGMPIAYWVSDKVIDCFVKGKPLAEIAEPRQGLATGDNDRFLRLWHEVDNNLIGLHKKSIEDFHSSGMKYAPYNKGGEYRKWYGNFDNVIKFDIENYKELSNSGNHLPSRQFYFKQSITWSFVGTSYFGVRYSPVGSVFDVGGSSIFPTEEIIFYLTGLMCSKISTKIMNILNPTINFQVGDVKRIPVINSAKYKPIIDELVKENIIISKTDWDSFETSWDFKKHPLLIYKSNSTTIKQAFDNWVTFTEKQFNRIKANEEELNRIFIEIYGLQDELTPEVEDKDITISRIYNSKEDIPESMKGNNYVLTREDVIKSFISYAVGCMFGRYSIDVEGLVYAGGNFEDKWRFENGKWKVRKTVKDKEGKVMEDTWVDAAFAPDMDNIIPITDEEYFEDDIVGKFVEFLKVTFGEDTLEENLDYIADSIGRKSSETARQAIRRYFVKEFYKDHVQVYQKKPIYWLFDSGKQDSFKAIIYMHRYDEFTVARIRTDYLHKLQKAYEAEIKRLDIIIDSNVSQREKTNARKKKEKIIKQMEECMQYDQIIAPVANQRIKIDLDDGVSINYSKFQGVEISQGEGRKPLTADLLAKI